MQQQYLETETKKQDLLTQTLKQMNPLPKYLHATAPDTGAGFIINTETGIIGKVIQFTDHTEMLTQINSGKWIAQAGVRGYSILLVYSGVISKGYKLLGRIEEAEAEMQSQANWYLKAKIETHFTRFNIFRL